MNRLLTCHQTGEAITHNELGRDKLPAEGWKQEASKHESLLRLKTAVVLLGVASILAGKYFLLSSKVNRQHLSEDYLQTPER
jgi:hypothetical protein